LGGAPARAEARRFKETINAVETILDLGSAALRAVGKPGRCPAALDHVSLRRRSQAVTLTNWINDTCRPDEMGHIAEGVPQLA